MKLLGGIFLFGALVLFIIESNVGSSQNFLFWEIVLTMFSILSFILPPLKIERIKD